MDITINDKIFSKSELIVLINQNKLQAIAHIRSDANVGLKDAKEIAENLERDPDFYDDVLVDKESTNAISGKTIGTAVKSNENRDSSRSESEHTGNSIIIENDNGIKRKLIFAVILIIIVAVVYFLI